MWGKRFQLWFLPSTHSAVILHAQNGDFIFSDGLQLYALSHSEKGVEWLLCWHTGRDPVNIAGAPVQLMTLKDPSDSLDKHQGSQPYP